MSFILAFSPLVLLWLPHLAAQEKVFLVRGRWVLDQKGEAVAPPVPGGRMMGLQASGLSFDGRLLWSVGDQRSNFPGSVFLIDPENSRIAGEPMPLELSTQTQGEVPPRLLDANPDLEGICVNPSDPSLLYIVVESDGPYVLECRHEAASRSVRVLRVLTAQFTESPARRDRNTGFEGIASDGRSLYIALERDAGGVPRVYKGDIPEEGVRLELKELPIPFSDITRRPEKGGLNVNGLALIAGENPVLIMLARDQERLLFYEPGGGKLSYVDLDFRDPEGRKIYWTSPEGVAVDPSGNRLWILNDPDSERGNYRLLDRDTADGYYESMVPLLFELPLTDLHRFSVEVRQVPCLP